ncbi:site-2 protease family protein [Patescibacteria group bacterium]|nr:site-2 protease family protein [Patescibacteria group bacterium]
MPINFLFSQPILFVAWAVALVIAISFHEFSHALAAYLLGDITAKEEGRLTLNPAAHLSLWGTVMLFLAGFGWGKPVPFNPYNLKHQRLGPVIIALAGPLSNLLLIVVFGLFFKFVFPLFGLDKGNALYSFLMIFLVSNAILLLFNLLPIPPLDGSKLLFAVMPDSWTPVKAFLQQYGFFILIGFILVGSPFLWELLELFQRYFLSLFIPF